MRDKNDINQDLMKYILDRSKPQELPPIVRTFEIDQQEIDNLKAWEETLPKYLSKVKFDQSFVFHTGGIGIGVSVRREYKNGKVKEVDITNYDRW
jgi:hypothetical protein